MARILGISAFYHDAAAALVDDGVIVAAAQEERFSRRKQDAGFPGRAITFCLERSGRSLAELDAVVFYEKPLRKFERLLETYYAFAPRGYASFRAAVPVWLKEKLFLRQAINDGLRSLPQARSCPPGTEARPDPTAFPPLLFTDHHLSHAASAFYPSPFAEAAILTVDGVGEWSTATIMHGRGERIRCLRELHFPHSIGLLYSAFTYYLGFKVNSGEYKLMGMAPYGNPTSPRVAEFRRRILEDLIDLKDDGSLGLNQDCFDFATGLRMIRDDRWAELFGFPTRPPESAIEQHHCDCALAIQQVTEEAMLRLARTARQLTGARYLCLAGGVALNCVANGRLRAASGFDDLWIQPAAGDAGGALGAALAAHHLYFGAARPAPGPHDLMQGAYLGPEYSELDTELMARRYGAVWHRFASEAELCDTVAGHLAGGKVVGWHQGRMEWGPRALGNRSILGDPRDPEMQKRLNLKIKYREGFRPFAPSVLAERVGELFTPAWPSPYMLQIADIKPEHRKPIPEDFHHRPLWEKLYWPRSGIQAVTHLDFSARLQTVHQETNPRYWRLIEAFRRLTGCPLLVNTSFNVRGEPIVCTPDDSYRCFMATDIDLLVIGDLLFVKEEQPDHTNREKWQTRFDPD